MSSFAPFPGAPELKKSKIHNKGSVSKIGQATQKPALKARMKADDSATVNMSDNRLGKGVSSD